MKAFNLIRAPEWWGFKLPPLLAVGYASALLSGSELYRMAPLFLFFLGSLAIGAVYVSVVNDMTDIAEDTAVGKKNRVAQLSPLSRGILVAGCLIIGGVFGYFMWPDRLTVVLYSLAWVAFSLYSIPPFRFKKRGILGVICDASGAHFFPSLFMVSGIYYGAGAEKDYYWLALIGVWALAFGCRGILWHQFIDRENDLQTNLTTFATKVSPEKFKPMAIVLFLIELMAFTGVLIRVDLIAAWVALLLYVVQVVIRYARYTNIPIILITPRDKHSQVLMIDYYQTFFPLSLLIFASFNQPFAWVLLVVHIALFPTNIIIPLRDYWMATMALYRRIKYF